MRRSEPRLAEDPRLYATLEIEPLTPEQVREYLAGFGDVGDQVVALMERRPELWEVVDSPLLLSVLVQASRSETWATAAAAGVEGTTRDLDPVPRAHTPPGGLRADCPGGGGAAERVRTAGPRRSAGPSSAGSP